MWEPAITEAAERDIRTQSSNRGISSDASKGPAGSGSSGLARVGSGISGMSEEQIVATSVSLGGDEVRAYASLRSYQTSAAKGKPTKRISCEVGMRMQ